MITVHITLRLKKPIEFFNLDTVTWDLEFHTMQDAHDYARARMSGTYAKYEPIGYEIDITAAHQLPLFILDADEGDFD